MNIGACPSNAPRPTTGATAQPPHPNSPGGWPGYDPDSAVHRFAITCVDRRARTVAAVFVEAVAAPPRGHALVCPRCTRPRPTPPPPHVERALRAPCIQAGVLARDGRRVHPRHHVVVRPRAPAPAHLGRTAPSFEHASTARPGHPAGAQRVPRHPLTYAATSGRPRRRAPPAHHQRRRDGLNLLKV